MIASVVNWLESRAGLATLWRHFFLEPVPKALGWPFCLGSMLLFLMGVQVATGVVLALYYAPTPDHAYASIQFIDNQVLCGRIVRGLHHWSASAMVVLAFLHMLRVIFWGSYKRPREGTWIIGVTLLAVIMAFSFTGYLLPWDQRSYWATVVGTRIAGTTPLIGGALQRILRGGEQVGALTLSRFFAVHIVLLPLMLLGFAAIHVLLLRKHGSSGHWKIVKYDEAEKEPFYPRQFWRDIVASLVLLGAILGMATFVRPGLEPVANPADTQFIPRPEWYFLALFQMLHYFTRHWEILGTLVIPVGIFAALYLLPWLDRGFQRNPFRRPLICGAITCAVILATYLTAIPILDDRNEAQAKVRIEKILPTLSPRLLRGRRLYERYACDQCHGIDGSGKSTGPDLFDLNQRRSVTYIGEHILDPTKHRPSDMPKNRLNQKDIDLLVQYLLTMKRE